MKIYLSKIALLLLFITLQTLISCSGGGGGDNNPTNQNQDNNDTTNQDNTDNNKPAIAGFDFQIQKDDYWEFEWDYYTSTASASGGSSGTKHGVFRITLGTPELIGDLTSYPLITTGNNRNGIDGVEPFITPRWTHIAIKDNQILLSRDGATFETVFDASTGYVIGFGFFEASDQNLFQISSGTIDNDYITGSAYVLSESDSASHCQYFPDYGTICGSDNSVDYTLIRHEYYQASVGPVGYYYHYSASTGGTFDSVSISKTINIGLVASSLRGDIVDYALETEPNNTPDAASPISYNTLPVSAKGDLNYQADIDTSLPENRATTYYLFLNDQGDENEPNDSLNNAEVIALNTTAHGSINSSDPGELRSISIAGYTPFNTSIEDWFSYQMTDPRPFTVYLQFYGAVDGVDIDLWLYDAAGNLVDYSIASNAATDGSDDSEYIRADLVGGTYYIGVDIYPDASDGSAHNADYTLSLNQASFGDDPAVTNKVAIQDFYRISVKTAEGLTITTTPSLAVFLTTLDGKTVLASAPSGVDTIATQTQLNTPILSPGDYLIAVGSQSYHWSSENYNFDTYTLTVDSIPASAQ